MTVKELKEMLAKIDEKAEVRIAFMDEIHDDARLSITGIISSKKEIVKNLTDSTELNEEAENSIIFIME